MNSSLPNHIDSKIKTAITELFPKYDKNKNDKLSADEIQGFINQALTIFGLSVNVSMKQIEQTILRVFDRNWDNMLNREQMYGCLKHIVSLELGGRNYFQEHTKEDTITKDAKVVKSQQVIGKKPEEPKVLRHFSEQEMDKILKDQKPEKANIRMVSSSYMAGSQEEDIIAESPVIEPRYYAEESLFNSSLEYKANKVVPDEPSPFGLKKDIFGLLRSSDGGLLPSPTLTESCVVEENIMKKSALDF